MLKKEVRILGLSTGPEREGKIPAVGVVFRGNLWLDAAFVCVLKGTHRSHARDLAKAIKRTKQYSQLHAVILSERMSCEFDVEALADKTILPVITIVGTSVSKNPREPRSTQTKRLNLCAVTMRKKTVNAQAKGMRSDMIRDIFEVSCAPGHHVPEAVRVANLLAEQVPIIHRKVSPRQNS